MEGIRFRETPEQARRSQRASIQDKLSRYEMLSPWDYDFLKQEADQAAMEMALKIEGLM